jgi:antitoxin (DNA-binding transcriptional repressor) of toxin-antitoxin stability system
MENIAVSVLRANLMKVLKQIEHGATLNITSRGKIVAKLVPPNYTRNKARKKLAKIAKSAVIGDVISPIDTEWEATKK